MGNMFNMHTHWKIVKIYFKISGSEVTFLPTIDSSDTDSKTDESEKSPRMQWA